MRPWPSTAFPNGAAAPVRPAAPGAGADVAFDTLDAFPERLRAEWDELADDAAEPNSFAESWFVAASLRCLAADEPVRLAEVRRGGRLVGTALFQRAEDYGRARIPHVENWVHCNQFLGMPLVRRGEEADFWAALLAALDGTDWAPAFLHLTRMVEGGPVHRGLEAAAAAQHRSCDIVHRRSRELLQTTLTPEEYLARNLSKKCRSELNRRRKRLAELGRFELRQDPSEQEVARWCHDFLELERSGWKGEAGSALACSPGRAAFFTEATVEARRRRRLHFLRLDLDGRAVAMLTAFLAPPGAFGFKSAFDETYARFSPGALLQVDNLAILHRPDIEWTDSCSTSDQPTMNGMWSERRDIVRLTVRLAGMRRLIPFAAARSLDRASAALRPLHRKKARQAP